MLPEMVPVADGVRVLPVGILLVASAHTFRHRTNPVAKPFVALVMALTVWAGLTLLPGRVGVPSPANDVAAGLELVKFVVALVIPSVWLYYIGRYTGRRQRVSRRVITVGLTPIVLALLIVLVFLIYDTLLGVQLPPVVFGAGVVGLILLFVYSVGLFLIGVYLLSRLARQYQQLSYTQVVTLGTALAAPYVFLTLSSVSEPTRGGGTTPILSSDVTFLGFFVAGTLMLYAMRRYPLFTAFPGSEHVARDTVVEALDEAVVILNEDHKILDLNTAAAGLSSSAPEQLLGRSIEAAFDGFSRIPIDSVQRLELHTPDGLRQFEANTSAIPDGNGGHLGQTVLLRDITERTTREQQLEVLTRVLRHNLRNDLDTVLAYAEEVADSEIRDPLISNAKRLGKTAEKARTIEGILATAQEPYTSVAVDDVVRTAAQRFRAAHPECTITVDSPADVCIQSHATLLDQLVTELLENAIQHTEQSQPVVDISVTVDEVDADRVRVEIAVADNGPGIPEQEREIIREETETPLKHGTGLGLWLVNWITTSLQGELSFRDREPTGSVVTVRIQAEQSSRTGPVDEKRRHSSA